MNKPFGPALNTAIDLLTQNLQRDLAVLLETEAKALELPEGTTADLKGRTWGLPEAKSDDPAGT